MKFEDCILNVELIRDLGKAKFKCTLNSPKGKVLGVDKNISVAEEKLRWAAAEMYKSHIENILRNNDIYEVVIDTCGECVIDFGEKYSEEIFDYKLFQAISFLMSLKGSKRNPISVDGSGVVLSVTSTYDMANNATALSNIKLPKSDTENGTLFALKLNGDDDGEVSVAYLMDNGDMGIAKGEYEVFIKMVELMMSKIKTV